MTISMVLLTIFAALLLSAVIGPVAIPLLRRMKFGQSIREEGPKSHMKKQGTPTMGGVIFLFSIIISTMAMSMYYTQLSVYSIVLLIVLLGFGMVGFLDDGLKIIFKRNLGLTSIQKLIAQIVISVVAYLLLKGAGFDNHLSIPYTDIEFNLGYFYVIFIVFWLVGFSNAVNLTDGLDGLVSGTGAVAFAAFGIIAYVQNQPDVAIFSFAVTGALLGFLIFNINPAKVFMGDTGSLALGGALGMVSIATHQELLLLLIGLVFVVETASVMLQVGSFKIRKKRIFKMAPIHHHFELSGWSEWRVVITFWLVGIICALAAVLPEVL
ncbi:phospho-N-acetylmuramoyl-pentapeptide-transferase [Kurthia zopfii]|uniref:Phospho-N-acetylmuramoyl-pentapeptide-transferase n=1 Tax=Kurthia zopfii TaxID=1650 RepID=A0A2U3AE47_9BACL|nr:phospho-N-acetylmuramoyl-pentapeptide-transferase [Kurthia zopfii]PWI22832.1 phospho-N-acetylmuramoyl-pentapeptide-transferase [Kurthia zopfii]TDR40204.1 phospho-N-acetylmuramoyl-pentapeptide-transferase [Kurthia zopfii]STX08996.1 Phospho-N-acetylmuramoyl-pentapeptide-transferase [Kurthia zopfii]VEI04790.1 Phospho-N-acetylmuramoyl-pentapeptide-transferase [Kurthia zopfii]GEK32098.1 phospho-N-acetylmuramoyl-pentapeptide-transferase [Kurthia zopfii]